MHNWRVLEHSTLSIGRSPLAKRFPRAVAHLVIAAAAILLAGGCATTTVGKGGSLASGIAGADGAPGQRGTIELQHCDAPLGAIALVEDQNNAILLAKASEEIQIPATPIPLLRFLLQQSNCFQVVDRAAGLRAIDTERALARDGLLKEGSEVPTGQMVAAEYSLTPHLVFAEDSAGGLGLGGAIVGAALLGPVGLLAGGVDVERAEAQVVMFLTDNRSGVQIAAAEGSAKMADWGFNILGTGSGGDGNMMGWSNSNVGKVVAAALVDGTNKIIEVVEQR